MTKKEYYQVLFELGLLDPEEDWELYKKQEKRYPVDDCFNKYAVDRFGKSLYNYSLNGESNGSSIRQRFFD